MAWMGRRSVCHNETARHYVRSRDFGGLLSPARRARWAAKNIRLGRTRDPARFAHAARLIAFIRGLCYALRETYGLCRCLPGEAVGALPRAYGRNHRCG